MGDIKARAKDVVRYEAFGDAGGVIEELVAQLEKAEAERDAALARIAEAAELHYLDTPSVGGDWCLEDHHEWPCPTAVALGMNEGENDGV